MKDDFERNSAVEFYVFFIVVHTHTHTYTLEFAVPHKITNLIWISETHYRASIDRFLHKFRDRADRLERDLRCALVVLRMTVTGLFSLPYHLGAADPASLR